MTTTTGDQTIVAGPITVSGAGSDGIEAIATGCANVSVTATGPISSASGIGIQAASGCTVAITTLPGANVSGGAAGIEATSGTGSAITIGAGLSERQVPMVFLTGYDRGQIPAKHAGVPCLTKPANVNDVIRTMENLLVTAD